MNGLDDAQQATIVGMHAAGDIDRIRINAANFVHERVELACGVDARLDFQGDRRHRVVACVICPGWTVCQWCARYGPSAISRFTAHLLANARRPARECRRGPLELAVGAVVPGHGGWP
jgi:hypothetical protein